MPLSPRLPWPQLGDGRCVAMPLRALESASVVTHLVAQRVCERLLRRSFRAAGQPSAFLIRAGLLIVWLRLGVSSFRPVLARGWHARAPPYHLGACESLKVVGAAQQPNYGRLKSFQTGAVAAP
jgi:hypothetical protein